MYIHVPPVGSTNKEFSFRHDWNSLISDDDSLLMKHYTKDYFPHADVYVSIHVHVHVAGLYALLIHVCTVLLRGSLCVEGMRERKEREREGQRGWTRTMYILGPILSVSMLNSETQAPPFSLAILQVL